MSAALAKQTLNAARAERIIRRLLLEIDEIGSASEGCFPVPEAGCLHCTRGTTPDRWNTGLCAYHEAQAFLEQLP